MLEARDANILMYPNVLPHALANSLHSALYLKLHGDAAGRRRKRDSGGEASEDGPPHETKLRRSKRGSKE